MQPFITCGSVLNVVACALLTIPAASDNLASLLVLWSLANIGFSCAVIPAQARAKMIGGYQTRNGQGQITGISKVTQALGQAIGPVLASELLIFFGPVAPWILFTALQVTVLILYLARGMPLDREPDWKSLALPPAATPEDGQGVAGSSGPPAGVDGIALAEKPRRSSARARVTDGGLSARCSSARLGTTSSVSAKILDSFAHIAVVGVVDDPSQ